MDVSELFKMISSIDEKKTHCRGNLRLKVLLKTTHDYARRSWIDGQSGNPQKLQTMLQNSIMNRSTEVPFQSDDEQDSPEDMNIEEFFLSDTEDETEFPTPSESVDEDPSIPSEIWEEHFAPIVKHEKENYYSGAALMFDYFEKKTGIEEAIFLCRAVLNGHVSCKNLTEVKLEVDKKTAHKKKKKKKKLSFGDDQKGWAFQSRPWPQKRSLSDANEDDSESLLELNGFFNKLKTLKFSDDNAD